MESKILLIVDRPDLEALLEQKLSKLPCQLSRAQGNVIQTVFDEVPHLIIVDEDFRNGEGRSIALDIKDDHVLSYIPVILLVKNREILPKEKPGKIDVYFEKGDKFEKLLRSVKQCLEESYNELDLNPLTHLPGTRSSVLRIERAIHSQRPSAVCYIDLSDLGAYNKAYGDTGGDKVIAKVAQIIQEVIKKKGNRDDFLGHLGGDDFILVTHSELAPTISEAIIQEFDSVIPSFYKPADRNRGYIFQKDKGTLARYLLMSISIIIVHTEKMPFTEISEIGRIVGELKKNMRKLPGSSYINYRYRSSLEAADGEDNSVEVLFPGKSRSMKVSPPSGHADKSITLINRIIEEKRIHSVYQPIIDLKTREIIGYEALTRNPTGEFRDDPGAMFSAARDVGRIRALDQLCVEFALKDAQTLGLGKKLFINLSHETLIDRDIMKNLFKSKGEIGFKNIVIEVTEQGILRSFDKVREALFDLKEQGVAVAIDDVGGGAVSLRDVAILKPDYMKFDRSLIRDIDSNITKQQIILSMILFANGIHAVTTAEGIETKREYETVSMLGISLGQGFYFARPIRTFINEIE